MRYVIGLDEVGRGSWAGPLAVGAVVIPTRGNPLAIKDSKKLTEKFRESVFDELVGWCVQSAVGMASAQECDELGMSRAQQRAAQRAIDQIGLRLAQHDPEWRAATRLLVDGPYDFVKTDILATPLVKGDTKSVSIAAASVIAKVTRDRLMRALDESFPAYNFASNKGYLCPKHLVALRGYGLTAEHRRSWAYTEGLPWSTATPASLSGL